MPDPDPNAPDPAMPKFFFLQLIRLGGVMLAVLGAVMISGRIEAPPILGYGLLVAGAFEFFAIPFLLARHWKSQNP